MKRLSFIVLTLCIYKFSLAQSIDTLNQIKNFSDFTIGGTPNSSLTIQSPNFSPLSFTFTDANSNYKTLTSPTYTSSITYDSIVVFISTTNTQSISLTMYNAPFLFPFNLPVNQIATYTKLNSNFINIPEITATSLANYPSSGVITFSNILVLGYYQNTTGVNEINSEKLFSIFPNPTTEIINISDESNQFQNSTIEIKNYLGQVVLTSPFTNQIDLSHLSEGMYFFSVQDNSNKKTINIIKE